MVCHGDNKSIQMQKYIHEACGKPPSMCDGTWGSLYRMKILVVIRNFY